MKRNKGTYGYLKTQLKWEIIKTILFYALCLLIFFTGLIYFQTRNNLMTVVAAVGCLPAGKSTVSMIMYMKAKPCSAKIWEQMHVLPHQDCFLFDLYLTAYKDSYQLSTALVCNKHILALSEDANCKTAACEEHIRTMLEQNGIKNYLVKVYLDADKYYERVSELSSGNQDEQPAENVLTLLKNISL